MKILILNGPNLNLLGIREKNIYGETSFEEYLSGLRDFYTMVEIDYYQSNVEGELINKIHEVGFSYDGIILMLVPTRILRLLSRMLFRRFPVP